MGGFMKSLFSILKLSFTSYVLLFNFQLAQAQIVLNASPGSLNFDQYVGQSQTRYSNVYINIYDEGSVNLNVNSSCGSDYRVGSSCGGMYWNMGSCNIRVEFSPKTPGTSSCYVRVNGFPSGYTDVYVTGRATKK